MPEFAERRPSPDALLQQAKAEARGKLKIYLGAAPGVGKTFEMLSDARKKRLEGSEIVAGVIETHGRSETAALLEGLEILPKRALGEPGRAVSEMDLDALLARKPEIALVDELAHTNAEGSRHPKRWMDVDELLAAGIDVWSTLNVQHIESLNDIVARITRVRVRETIPDAVLERADEIELIDLTPDELIERLKQGKVYAPDQAQRALRHYFAPGNLSALRELAMRRAADTIDEQVRGHRKAQGEDAPWAAGERLLVCVDEREASAEVVRHAKRQADRSKAPWLAVHVETSRSARLTEVKRMRLSETLRLAERLGAETATLPGDAVAETLLAYARDQNVTQIIVGKAKRSIVFEAVFGSVVRQLIDRSGSIPVEVIPETSERSDKALFPLSAAWPALDIARCCRSAGDDIRRDAGRLAAGCLARRIEPHACVPRQRAGQRPDARALGRPNHGYSLCPGFQLVLHRASLHVHRRRSRQRARNPSVFRRGADCFRSCRAGKTADAGGAQRSQDIARAVWPFPAADIRQVRRRGCRIARALCGAGF